MASVFSKQSRMATRPPDTNSVRVSTGGHRADLLIAIPLFLGALLIRLGFLAEYPNSLMHEDSGPYLAEAERLLEGRETTGGVPARPPGYPLFLAVLLRLFSTDVLHLVLFQHMLALAGILLLTICLRMMGVRRLFAYGFFIAIAFSHRLIHYDNTIGAETLSVFLMSLAIFLAIGMLLKRWNPWIVSTALGTLFAYLFLVRTASFFLPVAIAAWIVIPAAHRLDLNVRRRLLLAALVVLPPFMTAFTMQQWNKYHYGREVLSRETFPIMAFAVAYSGDFSGGKYPELKQELRPIIEAGRASINENGFYSEKTGNNYQWAYGILRVIDVNRLNSVQERDRIMRELFWETMLTPSTLYNHLSVHVWRELKFMLFDMTPVANSVLPPREYTHFVRRDTRGLRIAYVRSDRIPGILLAQAFPGPVGGQLQHFTSRYIHVNYHTEYKQKPGMIRIYSAISIMVLLVLLVLLVRAATTGWRQRESGKPWCRFLNPESFAALFVSLVWLGNALVMCTLLYSLHRYSYYVLPFIAFTAFYGLDRLARTITAWSQRSLPTISS